MARRARVFELTCLIVPLALALAAGACSGSRIEGLDASRLPEDVRSDYQIFAQRCSKCHSLARPLNSGITDDGHWVNYVNRMRRQPGSGITHDDQEHILNFLRYFAADLRRKKAGDAPASASASASGAPSSPPVTNDGGS